MCVKIIIYNIKKSTKNSFFKKDSSIGTRTGDQMHPSQYASH